jgi:hypothetical protein
MSIVLPRKLVLETLNSETGAWEQMKVPGIGDQRYLTLQAYYSDGLPSYMHELRIVQTVDSATNRDAVQRANEMYFSRHGYWCNKGETHRYAILKDTAWRDREASRLLEGRYVSLPPAWAHLPQIADHYAHVSYTDSAQIAFTPDEAKGMVDIQVTMRAGRYLTKFYPDMQADEVRRLAAIIEADLELSFAVTPDEIVEAYLNGPSSCMSHPKGDYSGHLHPVAVYGDSDLQLAYLKRGDRVTDRCLVWPDKKLFGRVYGGADGRIERALEEAGYKSGNLKGARIRKIANRNGDGWIMPYIDGYCSVSDHDDDWFTICGDLDATSTHGVLEEHAGQAYCEINDDYFDEDEMIYLEDTSQHVHQSCLESGDAFRCDGDGNCYSTGRTDMITDSRGRTYSQPWFDDNGGYYCEGLSEYVMPVQYGYRSAGSQPIIMADTENTYSTRYVTDNADDFHHCTISGDWYEDATLAPDYVDPDTVDSDADAQPVSEAA